MIGRGHRKVWSLCLKIAQNELCEAVSHPTRVFLGPNGKAGVPMNLLVEEKEESKRAVEIPNSEAGVRKVTNILQIGERSFGQSADDTVIGSSSRAKLLVEPRIRSLNVDADIYNGVVTSTGIVNSSD